MLFRIVLTIVNDIDNNNCDKYDDCLGFWGEVFASFPIQYEIVIAVQYFHIVIAMGAKYDNEMKYKRY